jgi:hypothetical protein
MRTLSFDLSTVCVGILAAGIDDDTRKIKVMKSCPIFPPKYDVSAVGFMKSKKKLPSIRGNKELNTWARPGETHISETEKKHRDVMVRELEKHFILTHISQKVGDYIENIAPNVINVEKNSMFNGILTIELLAKLMGTLIGIAGDRGIPLNEYKVQTVRKRYNPAKYLRTLQKPMMQIISGRSQI